MLLHLVPSLSLPAQIDIKSKKVHTGTRSGVGRDLLIRTGAMLTVPPPPVGYMTAVVVQNAVVDNPVLVHLQVSAAQCSSTLELLVMLALLHQLQGAGAAPLTQAALAEIEQALMPMLTEQLKRAAIALWLATTTSSQGAERLGNLQAC